MTKPKVIRYAGRDWSCIAMKAEPWREPEITGAGAWLQARYPAINFTPVRWRFICLEGIIAAVPLGIFDERGPDRIPFEIREKTEWREPWQDVQPGVEDAVRIEIDKGEDISVWEMGRRLKLRKQVIRQTDHARRMARKRPLMTRREFVARIESAKLHNGGIMESEFLDTYARINLRCPVLTEDEIPKLLNLFKHEAIYEGGGAADYFIRVESIEPMADEAAMMLEYNNQTTSRPCVQFVNGFTKVIWPGGEINFKRSPKTKVFRRLFDNYQTGNQLCSWRQIASDSDFDTSKYLNPVTVMSGNRSQTSRDKISALIEAIIYFQKTEDDYLIRLKAEYDYKLLD